MKMHRSPRETIRAQCLACTGGHVKEVDTCDGDGSITGFHKCPFHPYRFGTGRPSVKIMREFCLQCMGGNPTFVRECETKDCPIHPYRMGKNPARKGKGQGADRMAQIRLKKQAVSLRKPVYFKQTGEVQCKGYVK